MSNPQNSFTVFNLPVDIRLDLETLDKVYRQAQAQVHPDRFVGKTSLEQRIAAEQAMAINDAYQRLKSPIFRAQEILKSRGLSIPGDKGQIIQDPAILMEMMEIRESLMECKNPDGIEKLHQEVQEKIRVIENTFMGLTDDKMLSAYLRFVYLIKLLEDLKDRL